VSFLAVDVSNPHAFARLDDFTQGLALEPGDVAEFDRLLDGLAIRHAAEFRSHFIAESPAKLAHLRDYFAALCGAGDFPPVICNAPEFSAVVGVDGRVSPCFFIPGPDGAPAQPLVAALASAPMVELRRAIRAGQRPECRRCVCSMYREPAELAALRLPRSAHASR
jgi:MoaA/NifB/PqqE/SkfB family radical SAM enzyme